MWGSHVIYCKHRLGLGLPTCSPPPMLVRASRISARTIFCSRLYATESVNLSDGNLKPSTYGQPLFQSHPHLRESYAYFTSDLTFYALSLVQPRDLTPGIPTEDYERRRRALMDSLPDNSIAVCVAAPIKYMSASA